MVLTMPRQKRPDPGKYGRLVTVFGRALRADGRSPRTIELYSDICRWFGGWMLEHHPDVAGWHQVDRHHLRDFFCWLQDQGYSRSYVNNAGRSLQAFFKWFSAEEDIPNIFGDRLKPPPPPKEDELPAEVIATEQLRALLRDAEKGRDFESRRDAALLRLFASTGCRLAEITNLQLGDLDLDRREATVTGKGRRVRTVRFDPKCARALDRYLLVRDRHKHAYLPALWIGVRRSQAMTTSGVRQIIERRGEKLGLDIYPHLFRHTFSHRWLDAGGPEGDLMEHCGWDSPQMLRRYGRSARGARARRTYDRVNVMDDL